MGMPGTSGLLAALDAATFRQLPDESFEAMDTLPGWYLDFDPDGLSRSAEPLTECFPFLSSFVVDAQEFWQKQRPGHLRSIPWTQRDRHGELRHFDATAIYHRGSGILVIQLLGHEFETMRSALQKVRDVDLAEERLANLDQALSSSAPFANQRSFGTFPDALFRLRRDGSWLDFTEGHGEAVDRSLTPNVPDFLAKRIFQETETTLATRAPCSFEYLDDSGGEQRYIEVHLMRCAPDEVIVLTRDITARKDAEREIEETIVRLREHHDELLLVLNELRVAAIFLSPSRTCTLANSTAELLLGIEKTDYVGHSPEQILMFDQEQDLWLRETVQLPRSRRERLKLHWKPEVGDEIWFGIDVHDDPRDPQQKILLMYDVSEVHQLRRQLHNSESFDEIVGKSKPMQQVFRLIEELAPVDATVLIHGETGSGKELVARALHSRSSRVKAPFVPLNCAGLNESLIASQLFGHRRGSFTGAVQDQKGIFEAADGGTVFLDEIGDVPPSVQNSLLRVLQEKEIVRIGDTQPKKVDVRIVAATHRNLDEEVQQGRFRSDLLYRLRVARISLPALRERLVDLPLLVDRFLSDIRARTGKPIGGISADAMRKLTDYHWPGNVRELQSAIEFAAIRTRDATIDVRDLPAELLTSHSKVEMVDERERYTDAVKRARGNRSEAARLLGVSRATFYRRLAELDLNP